MNECLFVCHAVVLYQESCKPVDVLALPIIVLYVRLSVCNARVRVRTILLCAFDARCSAGNKRMR